MVSMCQKVVSNGIKNVQTFMSNTPKCPERDFECNKFLEFLKFRNTLEFYIVQSVILNASSDHVFVNA